MKHGSLSIDEGAGIKSAGSVSREMEHFEGQGFTLCKGPVVVLEVMSIIARGRAVEKDGFETWRPHELMQLVPHRE